jgi:hypothetical protein
MRQPTNSLFPHHSEEGLADLLPDEGGNDKQHHSIVGGVDGALSLASVRQRAAKPIVVNVRDRIRVRLWLQCIAELVTGSADETIFESGVRTFVDDSLRRRLEEEVDSRTRGMDEEVRAAKLNMLVCVQAISDEVDQRVQDKVAALRQEFDHRTAEQESILREMVDKRVAAQTAALQAEVDYRTNQVREKLEMRAKEQEETAAKLQLEVWSIREALEHRVREQEDASLRLNEELGSLRSRCADVTAVREALEAKVLDQQHVVARLEEQLAGWQFPGRISATSAGDSANDACTLNTAQMVSVPRTTGCWACLHQGLQRTLDRTRY